MRQQVGGGARGGAVLAAEGGGAVLLVGGVLCEEEEETRLREVSSKVETRPCDRVVPTPVVRVAGVAILALFLESHLE